MELFAEIPGLKGPPKATLARRAKSYSDFYEIAMDHLKKEARHSKPKDVHEVFTSKVGNVSFTTMRFEELEDDLLDASQEEYQYGILLTSRVRYAYTKKALSGPASLV
jgi:conserved oligomeric Golgi complex subunit 3